MFKLDEKERIIKAKVQLAENRPFWSYILMAMDIEQSEDSKHCPTMGVNKYGALSWNKDFVKALSDTELQAVLAHEAGHIFGLTFERQNNRIHDLWNVATDLIINDLLIQEGFSLPKDVLLTDKDGNYKFKNKKGKEVTCKVRSSCAEDVYEFLKKHVEIIKIHLEMDGEGNYKGQIDKHYKDGKGSGGKADKEDENNGPTKGGEYWKKKISEAAVRAKMRGNLSAAMERMLDGILNPKIDWRKKLYKFLTADLPVDYTMKAPGRRFYSTGIYFPQVRKENLEIICGCDVSGSIGYGSADSEGGQFISEAVGMCSSFPNIKLRMVYWGTEVHKNDDIVVTNNNKMDLVKHKPAGGGGTELSCFARYIKSKNYRSQVYVILTDGFIEENPKLPNGRILFVLSKGGNDQIVKKYGEVCKLSDVEK